MSSGAERRFLLAALLVALGVSSCVRIGVGVTNAPTIPDCIPGSATRPCN